MEHFAKCPNYRVQNAGVTMASNTTTLINFSKITPKLRCFRRQNGNRVPGQSNFRDKAVPERLTIRFTFEGLLTEYLYTLLKIFVTCWYKTTKSKKCIE